MERVVLSPTPCDPLLDSLNRFKRVVLSPTPSIGLMLESLNRCMVSHIDKLMEDGAVLDLAKGDSPDGGPSGTGWVLSKKCLQ
jgi:hypothetical protein